MENTSNYSQNECSLVQEHLDDSNKESKSNQKCYTNKRTRNPFFNFIQCARCRYPNIKRQSDLIKECAKLWKEMSDEDKKPFREDATKAPKFNHCSKRRRKN